MSLYHFIAAEQGHYPVRQLCPVLGVPKRVLRGKRGSRGRWQSKHEPGKRR